MLDLHIHFKSELKQDNVVYYDWFSPLPLDDIAFLGVETPR
mgnify:CR=1 FL=1